MRREPTHHDDAASLADRVVDRAGPSIVLALPLGLGKGVLVANALFDRAAADPTVDLRIFTALTLDKPRPPSELERRFIMPVVERLFGGYPDLAYVTALRAGVMPANVEVNEFFFLAGRWLGNPLAQQAYIPANYTHALGYVLDRGVNVIAQLISPGDGSYSLSCNPDLTLDLLRARREGRADFVLVGEVNAELPYMTGECEVEAGEFDFILENPQTHYPLYAPPKMPVSAADYATGLHIARLVPDGGTLQIGIGSIGDAVAQGLILRHRENAAFRDVAARLAAPQVAAACHDQPFETGLYGLSEMFVDSFLPLADAGILSREVDGAVLDAAFFLGPNAFYQRLREMNEAERGRLRMRSVAFVNQLYGDEAAKRQARVGARFVNNAMMATAQGAIVSDGLEDGRVVSGVGGQYNFVAQAFALDGARVVIALGATRREGARVVSNIRWSYGHVTIPRHLRDIVVTEYGVADLRGRTDAEAVAAMLAITDARFQDGLLAEAKAAGKIPKAYRIPDAARANLPGRIEAALAPARARGLLPPFPFGTDFTATEQRLMPALQRLKAASASPLAAVRLGLAGVGAAGRDESDCLARLGLDAPAGLRDRLYRALVLGALRADLGR
jgi:hypothetical protein